MDTDTPTVKPAWLTTEFWITVIPVVVVLIKLITGKDVQGVNITGLATLAVGIMTAAYGISRALQKKAVIQAKAGLTAQRASMAFDAQHNQLARAHEIAIERERNSATVASTTGTDAAVNALSDRLSALEASVPKPRSSPRKSTATRRR